MVLPPIGVLLSDLMLSELVGWPEPPGPLSVNKGHQLLCVQVQGSLVPLQSALTLQQEADPLLPSSPH